MGKVIDLKELLQPKQDRSFSFYLPQNIFYSVNPCPEGYDPLTSAIKFCKLMANVMQRRHPDIKVTVYRIPEMPEAREAFVSIGLNLPAAEADALWLDYEQISRQLQDDRAKWLVRNKSPEWQAITKEMRPQEENEVYALGRVW